MHTNIETAVATSYKDSNFRLSQCDLSN